MLRAGNTAPRCYRAPTPACGNRKVEGDEQCDGQYRGSQTCRHHGFFTGALGCSDNCLLTTGDCVSFQAVSAGSTTACGLDSNGRLWCWGNGSSGLLGGVFASKVERPVRSTFRPGLALEGVSVGQSQLCVLDAEGSVSCRGNPSFGPNSGPTVLAVGYFAACGIDSDGRAVCHQNGGWEAVAPAGVRFLQFASGARHSCVLDANQRAWCGGYSSRGQLGLGPEIRGYQSVAQEVKGNVDLEVVAAGFLHTCGVEKTTGHAWCWGWNGAGQLGDGSLDDSDVPRRVQIEGNAQPHFTALSTGYRHSCALDQAGGAWCWGQWLGDARPAEARGAVALFEGKTFRSISAGDDYTCATTDKTIFCWGWNGFGQLGVPSRFDRPEPLFGDPTFTSIATGPHHSCGIDLDGRVLCWGLNDAGQLGTPAALEPQRAVARRAITEIAFNTVTVGYRHTCGLDRDQRVWCWGHNGSGELGGLTDAERLQPKQTYQPLQLGTPDPPPSTAFATLASGANHSCAVDTAGVAWCWGDNALGQLGSADAGPQSWKPLAVAPPAEKRWVQITAGERHNCALADDQSAWCWGDNGYGQLGRKASETGAPAEVDGGHRFSALAAGGYHSCGLAVGDGQIWCWGNNRRGVLGFTSLQVSFSIPQRVPGLRAESIMAGAAHTCAVNRGKAFCWGSAAQDRLGRPADSDAQTPLDLAQQVVAISAGTSHTCALDEQGKAWCWGDNAFGRLGVDDVAREPVAVAKPYE